MPKAIEYIFREAMIELVKIENKPDADLCNPNINLGEIRNIYFSHKDFPAFDWTDLDKWNTRLALPVADDDVIYKFHVIGSQSPASEQSITLPHGEKRILSKVFGISFNIDETGNHNYDWLQKIERLANDKWRVWYEDGKYLYGGANGIPAYIVLNNNIPGSRDNINTFSGNIIWKNLTHPERIRSPFSINIDEVGVVAHDNENVIDITCALPLIIEAFIAYGSGELEGITYNEGELVVKIRNCNIGNFEIQVAAHDKIVDEVNIKQGELYITADEACPDDINLYNINNYGELEYEKT